MSIYREKPEPVTVDLLFGAPWGVFPRNCTCKPTSDWQTSQDFLLKTGFQQHSANTFFTSRPSCSMVYGFFMKPVAPARFALRTSSESE